MFKKIPVLMFASLAFFALSMGVALADDSEASFDENSIEDVCGFEVPDDKVYDAEVVAIRRKLRVETDEDFRVKVFIKNTGNMPWFSEDSKCLGPRLHLGTDKVRDRESALYASTLEGISDTNWEGSNRIGMDQLRTNPGEIASFTFWSKAPSEPDVLKEYFTPVVKDLQWIDNAQFSFELMVGDTGENSADLRKKISYANTSGSVSDIDLNADRLVLVDLSEQQMYVYLGDILVRQFSVSTGAAATPTPVGTTQISLKQEVRVGGKAPHYIMPYFQMFRAGGYGLHALPSLGNDGGVFWTEALSHLGIPVSHGCVRIGPDDAKWLFYFTEIGDTVTVQW
jgi:lipoprotein-anchoring transpeptidase ErfK/SrfK